MRERGGIQHAGWPGGAFRTSDGHWIVFTTPAQHLFERLCAMLGPAGSAEGSALHEPRGPRPPTWASCSRMVEEWFARASFDEAVASLRPTTSRTRPS